MSVHVLQVLPRDVRARDLGLVLGAAAPDPLVAVDVGAVRLGVLGASHVVTVRHDDQTFTEQVSCDAVGLGGQVLPDSVEDAGYRFTSTTRSVPAAEFDAEAARLRELSAQSERWLCGQFPGDRGALTVLARLDAESGGETYRWLSWHLYPSSDGGTVVATESWWSPR
jgi:hypothetical protein